MREILFRGKRPDNGEWVEGWYCKAPTGRWPLKHSIIPSVEAEGGCFRYIEVDPATVGQYTGLTDKNGKRIFEGDVVAFEDADADYEGYHDNVFMNSGKVGICPWCGVYFTNRQTVEMDDLYVSETEIEAVIIGNIHDNPELVKGARDE